MLYLKNMVVSEAVSETRLSAVGREGIAVRVTEARIKNFKGIEEWNLKFQPGFNLLKGENGTGKTSVLDAVALGLGPFVEWENPHNAPHFTTDNVRKKYQREGEGSAKMEYLLPVKVALTAEFPEEGQGQEK